jgi:excisionase family DNA binding protein
MSKLTSMASVRLLLTPEEAAEALGIKRAMMFELLAKQRVESVKIGRTRRIPHRCSSRVCRAVARL